MPVWLKLNPTSKRAASCQNRRSTRRDQAAPVEPATEAQWQSRLGAGKKQRQALYRAACWGSVVKRARAGCGYMLVAKDYGCAIAASTVRRSSAVESEALARKADVFFHVAHYGGRSALDPTHPLTTVRGVGAWFRARHARRPTSRPRPAAPPVLLPALLARPGSTRSGCRLPVPRRRLADTAE